MSERPREPARPSEPGEDEAAEPVEPAADGAAARIDPTADDSGSVEPAASGGSRTGTMSMADYEEAMSDRNVHARLRGLSAPYIAGGRDPEPDGGLRQDRFYLRLLALMVFLIIVGGLVVSIAVYVATGGGQ